MTMEPTNNGKHPGGRPTKLTPELQKKIITAIKGGNYVETAVAMVGISKETFFYWLRRAAAERDRVASGKNGNGNGNGNGRRIRKKELMYVEFSDLVAQAQGESESRDVLRIDQAGNEDWRAIAWRLERKFPDRWGHRQAIEVSGPDKGPVEIDVRTVFDVVRLASQGRAVVEPVEETPALPEGDPAE